VARAIDQLGLDGFLAYPTETVWGLGACADREVAIARLMRWKGRGSDAPLSVLVASIEIAEGLGCRFEASARRLATRFWPGPLTLVVSCSRELASRLAPGVARADGALGLRCSPHPVARALALGVHRAGLGPLTATSLNRTGEPAAADVEAARRLLAAERAKPSFDPATSPIWIEDLVPGPELDAGGGAPSSVVDCTSETPETLRVGAISHELLERTWNS
jgi:tRNA threonylcarbamoyl adenosine modification protein (Sua5/YciO/YrdC/YwlC family)